MPENMARDCRVLRPWAGIAEPLVVVIGACAERGGETRGKKRKDQPSRSLALPTAEAGPLAACKTDFPVEKSGISRYVGQMHVVGSLKLFHAKCKKLVFQSESPGS